MITAQKRKTNRLVAKWMLWPWLTVVLLSTVAWGAPAKKAGKKKGKPPIAAKAGKTVARTAVTLLAADPSTQGEVEFVLLDTNGTEVAALQHGITQKVPLGRYKVSARRTASNQAAVMFEVTAPQWIQIKKAKKTAAFRIQIKTVALSAPPALPPPPPVATPAPTPAKSDPVTPIAPPVPATQKTPPSQTKVVTDKTAPVAAPKVLLAEHPDPTPYVCSWCAEPRLPNRTTTLDVTSGYPWLFHARALASVWTSERAGLSLGGGARAGLHEFLIDAHLIPHVYRTPLFSLALPLSGSVGAAYNQSPSLVKETAFEGALAAGVLGTFHPTDRLFVSMQAAFEYKRIMNIPVFYAIQDGPDPAPQQTYRSPYTVGVVLEPSIELAIHRRVNLSLRGGYTFRWPARDVAYALPQNLLSTWHVNAGVTLVF